MFAELVELGRRVYKGHDAFEPQKCNWDIVIDSNGNFRQLVHCEVMIEAEKLPAKKGRARLLLDKPEETLFGYRDCQEDSSGNKNKTEEEKNLKDISTNFRNIDSLKNWSRSFLFIVNRKRLVKPLKLSEMEEAKKET